MKLTLEELRLNYNSACNAYLAAFCEKHGYDYEPDAWVGNDPGGIAEVGDLFVSMADMLTDIDRDAPEEEYIKYYDYCMRVGGICDGKLNTPNYDSWLRGCPRMDEEQIARLEELQRDVRCAEMNLKVEIDRINNLKQELKDNNGTDVWEGDIVEWENLMKINRRSVIAYRDRMFCFVDANNEPEEIWCCSFTKIGNIHDTPELLKTE